MDLEHSQHRAGTAECFKVEKKKCFRDIIKHQAIDADEPSPFRAGSSVL